MLKFWEEVLQSNESDKLFNFSCGYSRSRGKSKYKKIVSIFRANRAMASGQFGGGKSGEIVLYLT